MTIHSSKSVRSGSTKRQNRIGSLPRHVRLCWQCNVRRNWRCPWHDTATDAYSIPIFFNSYDDYEYDDEDDNNNNNNCGKSLRSHVKVNCHEVQR